MPNVNQLTEAQLERLAILGEEAGEVQKEIGKIIRHGYTSYNPDIEPPYQMPNREKFTRELGDLLFAIRFICFNLDVAPERVELFAERKTQKIVQYLHYHSLKDIPKMSDFKFLRVEPKDGN